MGRLEGKAALITGSSSGIGCEIAKLFAREGASVMVTGRNRERCEKVVKEIRKNKGRAECILYDLYQEDAPEILLEKMETVFGGIDILVNNAAWWKGQPFLETNRVDFRRGFSEYLESIYFLTQAAAREMIGRKKKGKIVHIASTAAYYGERGMSVYCAAKAAVVNLTRAMALELGPHEICVNAVAPGTTVTNNERRPNYVLESFRLMGALPELNTAEKIAPAVVFLASEDSDGITGETLVVDGGCVQIRMPEKLYETPIKLEQRYPCALSERGGTGMEI